MSWGCGHRDGSLRGGGLRGHVVWGVWVFCRVRQVKQGQVFWLDEVHHVRSDFCWELVALA